MAAVLHRHFTNVQVASVFLATMINEWNYLFCYGHISCQSLASAQETHAMSPDNPTGMVHALHTVSSHSDTDC